MDVFLTGMMWFCALSLVVCLWAFICNERTFRHKVNALHEAKNVVEINMVSEVPYTKHMFCLMTFRNPKKLYNEQVRGYF